MLWAHIECVYADSPVETGVHDQKNNNLLKVDIYTGKSTG